MCDQSRQLSRVGGCHIDDVNLHCFVTSIYLCPTFSVGTSPSAETLMSVKQVRESEVKRVGSWDAGDILVRLWLNPNAKLARQALYVRPSRPKTSSEKVLSNPNLWKSWQIVSVHQNLNFPTFEGDKNMRWKAIWKIILVTWIFFLHWLFPTCVDTSHTDDLPMFWCMCEQEHLHMILIRFSGCCPEFVCERGFSVFTELFV